VLCEDLRADPRFIAFALDADSVFEAGLVHVSTEKSITL